MEKNSAGETRYAEILKLVRAFEGVVTDSEGDERESLQNRCRALPHLAFAMMALCERVSLAMELVLDALPDDMETIVSHYEVSHAKHGTEGLRLVSP